MRSPSPTFQHASTSRSRALRHTSAALHLQTLYLVMWSLCGRGLRATQVCPDNLMPAPVGSTGENVEPAFLALAVAALGSSAIFAEKEASGIDLGTEAAPLVGVEGGSGSGGRGTSDLAGDGAGCAC